MADCATEVEVVQPSTNQILIAVDGYVIEVPGVDYDVVVEAPTVHEVDVVPPPAVEVLVGIPGEVAQTSRCIYRAFDYATASPLFLGSQQTDEFVESATVVITTAFDDAAADLLLGDGLDPDSIFGTTEVKPGTVAQFECPEIQSTTVLRHLFLTIDPGSATQGAGYVLIRLCEV